MSLATWTTILVAYIVGGLTFIPIVVIAIVAHGHLTFPHRPDASSQSTSDTDHIIQDGDDTTALEAAREGIKTAPFSHDVDVASGYFAVYREYIPTGINAKPVVEKSSPSTPTTVSSPSPSVYQTMYRSIFDRKPTTGPLDGNKNMQQRPKKAGNIFYVVLRHGHLMLFDDEEQLEVRHVISLSHHEISIYSGGDLTPEGELFIKRNALCLSRRHDIADANLGPASKPFYLFSEHCSAKEDFYFALLKNQQQTFGFERAAPTPKQFELKSIISLVQKLHSSEDQVHSRWLNAILGRIFLGVYRTSDLKEFIADKITKKISRVKRPSFLTSIKLQKIDTGDAAPYFTNMRLKDLTVEGECLVEADVKYTGNFRIEVAATAKIDLGTRFKAREVNLVLAVVLRRLEGHMLFKIKAPPSNRIWFSFHAMPKLEMAIEPIVSSRQITYTVITRHIENRIKEVFAETLVQPYWDDVPFFRTEHKTWRGGIFDGDGVVEQPVDQVETIDQDGDVDADSQEALLLDPDITMDPYGKKSASVSAMDLSDSTSTSSRKQNDKIRNIPAASVSSTGVDLTSHNSNTSLRPPKLARPQMEPVVAAEATHGSHVRPSAAPPDLVSTNVSAPRARSEESLPHLSTPGIPSTDTSMVSKTPSRPSSSSSLSREVATAMEIEAASNPAKPVSNRSSTYSSDSGVREPNTPNNTDRKQGRSLGRSFFNRRDTPDISPSTSSVDGDNGLQKRNTLTAVTNAAVQARQWGWNAIQRQRDAIRNGEKANVVDLSQPMGRGQPLPPPGMPLPGPNNNKSKIKNIPDLPKRKQSPVLESQELPAVDVDEPKDAQSCTPPLPPRRRRGDSRQQIGNTDQNILVVAAPDDSQPSTPTANENLEYLGLEPHDPFEDEPHPLPMEAKGSSAPTILSSVAPLTDDDIDFSAWMNDTNSENDLEQNVGSSTSLG